MKRSLIYYAASFFVLLCILFVPFPFYLLRFQLDLTEFLFGKLIGWTASTFFNKHLANTEVHSDATAMYILVLLLLVLSILLAALAKTFQRTNTEKLFRIIYYLALCYLSLQLLKYGLDKIFKNQFYLPEPNTLYTPLGEVPRDLLYWSSMGTSHCYNVFLGFIELIAAILLMIGRTRLPGLLVSFFVLINILAVNFGFDINVKLFSILLLIYNMYLLWPYAKRLWQFFILKRNNVDPDPPGTQVFKNPWLATTVKWFVAGIILLECFLPFFRAGNFNGDLAKRPPMHGAYEVISYVANDDTLQPINYPFKRFFIHRDSYLIFQSKDDRMTDFKLSATQQPGVFVLTNYSMQQSRLEIDYREADSLLTIRYVRDSQLNVVTGKAINWRTLPALKKEFHWTVD